MLTRLRLRNFKSWSDTGDIPLRPITAFFGANSSGKTGLLQALLLMKQTSESSDRSLVFHFGNGTTPVDLGDFPSVVHGHNAGEEIGISLDWKADKAFDVVNTESGDSVVLDRNLGFSIVAGQRNNGRASLPFVREMSHRVGDARFGMQRREPAAKKKTGYDLFAEGTDFKFGRSAGRVWPLPSPVKGYGFPDQVRAYYRNAGFLADLQLAFEERLRHVYYLGPLRAYPERRYTWAGVQPTDMGRAGASAVDAILASRERGQKISRGRGYRKLTLEEYVAHWLKQLGLIYAFRIESIADGSPLFRVLVKKTPVSPEVLITDVGFGVSQILPVLVLCLYVPEGSTLILEQPEIHLHPAIQSGLADILIDARKRRNVQILVESHSEHFLRRLQRRIAEEDLRGDDVGVFFCEAIPQGSSVTKLEINLFGAIANWPKDFFGDELGEIVATASAAQRRRRENH